jgi:hypothetical protein
MRSRHEHRRLVAGIAKHKSLIASALFQIETPTFINALRNILALFVGHQYRAALVIDAVLGVVVADALDGVASNLNVINIGARGDFACEHD